MPRTRCGRRKELLFTSPPAVAAAATARATATASGSAPALAPAPPVARTEHRGTLLAAEETSARPAARAYFGQESSAGTREEESPDLCVSKSKKKKKPDPLSARQ